ncbi:MAG: hypothetical protein R2733_02275 [Acidimicrobiales bacterium]
MAVKRLLAVVVAVALITGAVVIRRFIDDGGELSLGGASSTIYCDSALADACRSVFDAADLKVEAPGVTLDRFLDDTDDGPVVWIAADLWFDILASEQQRVRASAEVTSTSGPIVHSPLVILGDVCAPAAWSCFLDLDRSTDAGLDALDTSAGVAAYTQIAAVKLGTQTFATNDFDLAFNEWRRNLDANTTFSPARVPVLDIYLTRRGTYDLIATTQAQANQLGRSAELPTDAGPELEVGAVALNGARLPGALDDLASALVADGWTDGAAPDAERPSGGAMQALRS